MSTSEDLDHEMRLRVMETKLTAHEARCDERYKQIVDHTATLTRTINDLIATVSKRFDLLLLALIILATSMALGPEIALRLFGPK